MRQPVRFHSLYSNIDFIFSLNCLSSQQDGRRADVFHSRRLSIGLQRTSENAKCEVVTVQTHAENTFFEQFHYLQSICL